MLKTTLLALACSSLGAAAMFAYVGHSHYSTPFQLDFPLGGAFKVTPDPANIWSWHHQFTNVPSQVLQTADVLVDIDGDMIMDTVHSSVRVMITDVQLVVPAAQMARAWIVDANSKRLAVGVGGFASTGPVQHISLSTPIVLPIGSPLHVELLGDGGTYEVHMIGRIVNP